jgi:putative aminopeptidase FrvX
MENANMELINVLEKLSNACGVAGREDEVRLLMTEMLKPSVDEMRQDKLGNLIGVKKGRKATPAIMLAAHMDEIGLMIKNVTKDGFMQFSKIGGIDDRILVSQRVVIHTEKGAVPGVIGSKPPHILKEEERKKVTEADDLFIDIGAKDREESKKMGIQIGDTVSLDVRFVRIATNAATGKAFDNRAGCTALIGIMKDLPPVDCTVYAVGTIQEEVGARGAGVSAFGLNPDVALALDVTVAGDVPGVREVEAPAKMRNGPSLTIADYGLITHPKVMRWLIDAAEEAGVPYQLESGMHGSTDAARISLTREGIPSGVISIPVRYIHSGTSILSLEDLENTVRLGVAAAKSANKYF